MTHLKAGINEAHVLLNGVVEGWAGHATTPQDSHGLLIATPMVHHFPRRQHVCLVEEAADVCRGLLHLHHSSAALPTAIGTFWSHAGSDDKHRALWQLHAPLM